MGWVGNKGYFRVYPDPVWMQGKKCTRSVLWHALVRVPFPSTAPPPGPRPPGNRRGL